MGIDRVTAGAGESHQGKPRLLRDTNREARGAGDGGHQRRTENRGLLDHLEARSTGDDHEAALGVCATLHQGANELVECVMPPYVLTRHFDGPVRGRPARRVNRTRGRVERLMRHKRVERDSNRFVGERYVVLDSM